MKKFISLMLIFAMIVLPIAAMAEVTVKVNSGNSSNYRSEPNLDGEKLGDLKSEETLLFTGETSTDDRGVVWYKVWIDNENTAWISSKFTSLSDGEVDGLTYDVDLTGPFALVVEDTLAGDPYKKIGAENLAVDTIVYGTGLTVDVDSEETWLKVATEEGVEGWLALDNLVAAEEEAAE